MTSVDASMFVCNGASACSRLAAELLLIVRQVGSRLPEQEVALLASAFGTHKANVVDAAALLKAIRMHAGRS